MKRFYFALLTAIFCVTTSQAQRIVLQSEPDDVDVYMNGQLVGTTPTIITVSSKLAKTPILFHFKKEGYDSKSMTMTWTKKELKNTPVVRCSLKKNANAAAEEKDPTIRHGEAQTRVDRDNAGKSALERAIIRWSFESDPAGARVFWRVISSVPDEVKNTNETYLTTTPYEETRSFNILGLTYENSRDVTIEVKVKKKGYNDQVKRYNVRQAIDQQEISGFFELVKKDEEE